MRGFQDWVTCLTTELNTSDLWSTVSGDTQLLKMSSDQDNRPFTPDEQLQIKEALDRIKWVLSKCYALAGARLDTIEARLTYLQDCVTRMSRKDFVHITMGILVNTRELFQWAGHHLEPLLHSLADQHEAQNETVRHCDHHEAEGRSYFDDPHFQPENIL